MPVPEAAVAEAAPAAAQLAPGRERIVSGWGRTARSRARVLVPRDADDVAARVAAAPPGGLIARGAGRNYGDAAQNAGGEVLDMTALDRVLAIDAERRLVTVQAGATIAAVMAALAPHELTLPVVPGTRHVTIAGAIASDIHGKNHHRDGGFARHVSAMTLCTPAEGLVEVSAESDPELFYGTLGGMGLTGVVVQATLAAMPLPTPWVAEDLDRTSGLQQTLELLAGEEPRRYSVAWLDLLAPGESFGRALVSRADPVERPSLRERPRVAAARTSYAESLVRGPALTVPAAMPGGLLRPAAVRAFNELRWRRGPRLARGRRLEMAPYFFPLDAVGDWNRLYGRRGLLQYQFVVPTGAEASLERCFELLHEHRAPVYLAVFKRFGPAFGGPLSFPLEGWTLAVDVPAAWPGVTRAFGALDEAVAACGGRVYLTKDVRLRPELLPSMYPLLRRFRSLRARVDPEGALSSDLARRLGLDRVDA
jgi:decaprenylphospho-beta-D-ribofuranose 2-oxidase